MGERATDRATGDGQGADHRASADGEDATAARDELVQMADELERANAKLAEAIDEARAFGVEMATRTAELDGLHDIVEATLAHNAQVLLVVDGQLVVRGWSGGAAEHFGTTPDRALGRRLVSLRCAGLPSGHVAASARDVLAGRRAPDDPRFACFPIPDGAGAPEAVVVVFDRPGAGGSGVDHDPRPEPGDDAGEPT